MVSHFVTSNYHWGPHFTFCITSCIIESSEEAVNTVDNLLDYESIDSGLIKLDTVSAPLRNCFKINLRRLSRLAESRNIALIFEDSSSMFNRDNNATLALSDISNTHVYFDLFRVFQIIQNLVTNAVKFSSEGESIVLKSSVELLELLPDTINSLCSPPVECNLTRSATLCIEVIDTGVGMSTDQKTKCSNPFNNSIVTNCKVEGAQG